MELINIVFVNCLMCCPKSSGLFLSSKRRLPKEIDMVFAPQSLLRFTRSLSDSLINSKIVEAFEATIKEI